MHTKPIWSLPGIRRRAVVALFSGLWLVTLAGCVTFPTPPPTRTEPVASAPAPGGTVGGGATRDDNAGLGNPSNAAADNPNNYLIIKPDYTLSYNRQRSTANWVSWHLSTAWRGGVGRSKQFTPDFSLPAGWYVVKASDYTNTGFDRGHLCPSDDRNATEDENAGTFVLTNIVPQSPKNNRETWKYLEEYSRKLLDGDHEVYIMAGPAGTGGTGELGYQTALANGRITVPASLWKIIVVLPIGTQDAYRLTTDTRVIAVIMPNTPDVAARPWTAYLTSVNAIEQLTGFSFFSNVPPDVQRVIKARVDRGF